MKLAQSWGGAFLKVEKKIKRVQLYYSFCSNKGDWWAVEIRPPKKVHQIRVKSETCSKLSGSSPESGKSKTSKTLFFGKRTGSSLAEHSFGYVS